MQLASLALLAEDAAHEELIGVPSWVVGGVTFLILALLLYIVTRLNIDR